MVSFPDSAGFDGTSSSIWELAEAAARLERSVLARRLHNGPLQDIAAATLTLQAEANRADQASRPAFERAIAVLIEQQRTVRHMVEGMLGDEGEVPIALILEALTMQRRASGATLTWKVIPADATLTAHADMTLRLKLIDSLHSLGSEAQSTSVVVEVRGAGDLHVTLSGSGTSTVEFSVENTELPT